ncbi:MAG: tetratricopeptide repeat protein [Verrucomicrobiota bacterium]|nr:tetratricopeptide repeat protein [Verrucomicrobiota bacterium]
MGIAATESGDLERGQKNLEIAYAYVPNNAEINFALANLWLNKNDRDKAKQFYRHTIELDPRHAGAWNNLGVMAMREGRWDLADRFLSASLGSEPEDAKTWYLLAKVKREKHDLPAARGALDRALKLKKDQPEFRALQDELGP